MAVMARNGIVNLGVASATSRSTFFKTASSSSSSSSTAFQGQLVMPHLLDWKQLLDSQPLIYVVRKKKHLSSSVAGVGCVAQIATSSSSSSVADDDEVREKKKKADAYFASDSRPIVLFDGVCNMCNGGVNFVLDNDPVGYLLLLPLALLHLRSYGSIADLFSLESLSGSKKGVYSIPFADSDLQLCKVKQEELSCCDQAGHLMISPVWSLLRKTGHTLSLREFYGRLSISNPCFLQLPALPSFFPYSSETLFMKALLTTVTQSLDKQMCVECQMHNSRSASLSNLFFHLN